MWIAYYYVKDGILYLVAVVNAAKRVLVKQTNTYMDEQYGKRGEGWKTKKHYSLYDVRAAKSQKGGD